MNDYGDYESEDDSSVDLPPIVDQELKRRKADADYAAQGPASDAVLAALRAWFLKGDVDPACHGGYSYMTLLEKLGVTPRSDDVLVKEPKYNTWYISFREDDSTDEEQKRKDILKSHESKVRLLRYGEFLDRQEQQGLGPFAEFHFFEEEEFRLDDRSNEGPSSLPEEDDLSMEQILAMGSRGFLTGFYHYANHEKLYHGIAPASKLRNVAGLPPGMRTYEMAVSEGTIHKQLIELRDRYRQHRKPLGPTVQFEQTLSRNRGKKKSKKTKEKSHGLRDHATEIKKHVQAFLTTLNKIAKPTAATAYLYAQAADTLSAAVDADIDIARALLGGQTVLQLRQNACDYAKQAQGDTNRPFYVALAWWQAYDLLSELMLDAIAVAMGHESGVSRLMFESRENRKKRTPDMDLAIQFYEQHLESALLASIASSYTAEQSTALRDLGQAIANLPTNVAKRIAKDQDIWKLLQGTCTVSDQGGKKLDPRAAEYEKKVAPYTASRAVTVFVNLCQRGMELDDSLDIRTNVAPSRLAFKMISGGVVPLLMDLTRSPHKPVVNKALEGLAQISRVKDCRLLLLQNPKSIVMIREILTSNDGAVISHTFLLLVHLLWDEEWRGPIFSIQDPPLEQIAARWATYSMKSILKEACRMKSEEEKYKNEMRDTLIAKFREKLLLAEGDPQHDRIDLEIQEIEAKGQSKPKWTDVEQIGSIDGCSTLLRRCVLLLGTMNHSQDPERLMKVNTLHLAACCIDAPDSDTHGAAAVLIMNMISSMGKTVEPSMFPDPDHLLRSLILRVESCFSHQEKDQRSLVIMQLASRLRSELAWKPYFDELAARDEMYKFWIESILGGIVIAKEAAVGSRSADVRTLDSVNLGINKSCSTLTGKLKECNGCGKVEEKKGVFKKCSRCQAAWFCGRTCQVNNWKKHKKHCVSK